MYPEFPMKMKFWVQRGAQLNPFSPFLPLLTENPSESASAPAFQPWVSEMIPSVLAFDHVIAKGVRQKSLTTL